MRSSGGWRIFSTRDRLLLVHKATAVEEPVAQRGEAATKTDKDQPPMNADQRRLKTEGYRRWSTFDTTASCGGDACGMSRHAHTPRGLVENRRGARRISTLVVQAIVFCCL